MEYNEIQEGKEEDSPDCIRATRLKKWLGYRDNARKNGTPLTLDEASWFRGMVCRLAALLLLHDELDAAYEQTIDDAWTSEELGLA